jgi:hypothetical protein
MMTIVSLFGDDKKDEAGREALAAELQRIGAMPLEQLAQEVMVRAWGRGGPGDAYAKAQGDTGLQMYEIQQLFGLSGATTSLFGSPGDQPIAIVEVVEEALQQLEHAGLVFFRVGGGDIVKAEYRPTRAGLEAIHAGDVRARLEARSG